MVMMTPRCLVRSLVFAALLGGSPSWLWAQSLGGPWPPRVQQILDELARQHPTWVADDSGGPENTPRYRLNKMVAEQVVCDLGPQWGLKRADPRRPISSEVIAYANGASFLGWEWENSHDGRWEQFPGSIDLAGQTFVPVACVNHLTPEPPPPPPTPSPSPAPSPTPPPLPPLDLSALATKEDIARLEVKVDAIANKMGAWEKFVKSKWTYITGVFGVLLAERFNAFGTNPQETP